MAVDVTTTREGEARIRRIVGRLGDPDVTAKWYVLRLALAASMRRGTVPARVKGAREAGRGETYKLQQVTGLGKSRASDPNITGALRAMLSVIHGRSFFSGPDDVDSAFCEALEAHIERGLFSLDCRLADGENLWTILESWAGSRDGSDPPRTELRGDRVIDLLRGLGIKVATAGTPITGPRWTRYPLRADRAQDLDSIREHLDQIAFALQRDPRFLQVSPGPKSDIVLLDVLRDPGFWKTHTLDDLRGWLSGAPKHHLLSVCPGVAMDGTPFWFDLAEAPHLLIGGTTGSGKSSCVHSIIASLVLRLGPSELQIGFYDPKRLEGRPWRGLPHLRWPRDVVTEPAGLIDTLRRLVEEMEARIVRFDQLMCRDIDEARRKGESVPRIVMVMDELADAVAVDGAVPLLDQLARKARAAGIHLVAATQRPDAKTFPGQLRSNLPSRIALRVLKASESKIIIDENGAENLEGPGEMLIRLSNASRRSLQRVHGLRVTGDDVLDLVASMGGSK